MDATKTNSTTAEEGNFPAFGHSSLQDFSKTVLQKVVYATQRANALAGLSEDFEYWNSFPDFREYSTEQGARVVNNIGGLFRHHAVQCAWSSGTTSFKDVEERFERLVDANDIMLENVGSLLDEASGLKKNDKPILPPSMKQSSPIVSSWNKRQGESGGNRQSTYKLLMAKNIERPQLKWLDKIDNCNTPFMPYLKRKPNAVKELEYDAMETDDVVADFIHQQRIGGEKYDNINHPYEYEISHFELNDWQLEETPPQAYSQLQETSLSYVDSQVLLDDMMNKLKQAKEIAIDLEHHSYRSFQGFVCLMQISTRTEDFIVDTLKLRDELHVLNDVFTDPTIVKVLHGADMDIGWLQRDFGVYIVNMFDTGQAARTLHEERFSLAHLLHKYCDVTAQKQFQLADWRIRPLPDEMMRYAREDTHYLLYIYDVLRNKLISHGNEMKNLLRSVYSKSSAICSTIYHKPMFFPDSHFAVYKKYRGRLNPKQLECLRLVYGWRDKTAREEDESYGYTLPNHMMFQIAENLPKEPPGIIACCNPVPPLVKQRVMDIHQLVLQAREFDPVKTRPVMTETTEHREQSDATDVLQKKFASSVYHTKTGFEIYDITGPPVTIRKPSLTAFEEMDHLEITEGKRKAKEIMSVLRSPFEMYLPNTGKEAVNPNTINQTWQTASKEKLNIVEQNEELIPVKEVPKKEKRKSNEMITSEEQTLREMLPKKKRQKENSDITSTQKPVEKVTYDKTVKGSSDYVPFNYSKSDLKKFTSGQTLTPMEVIEVTQEPKFGKVVRTKVHSKSGARSMTYK